MTALLAPYQSNFRRQFKGLLAGFETQVRERPRNASFYASQRVMSLLGFSVVRGSLTASQGRWSGTASRHATAATEAARQPRRRLDCVLNVGLEKALAHTKPRALRCSVQASGRRVSAISLVAVRT